MNYPSEDVLLSRAQRFCGRAGGVLGLSAQSAPARNTGRQLAPDQEATLPKSNRVRRFPAPAFVVDIDIPTQRKQRCARIRCVQRSRPECVVPFKSCCVIDEAIAPNTFSQPSKGGTARSAQAHLNRQIWQMQASRLGNLAQLPQSGLRNKRTNSSPFKLTHF